MATTEVAMRIDVVRTCWNSLVTIPIRSILSPSQGKLNSFRYSHLESILSLLVMMNHSSPQYGGIAVNYPTLPGYISIPHAILPMLPHLLAHPTPRIKIPCLNQ